MILIASNSQDRATFQQVADHLKQRGQDTLLYNSDEVARGTAPMAHRLTAEGQITISYEGRTFDPAEVTAAWYRRPESFRLSDPADRLKNIYLNRQRKETQDALWYAIPRERWLNAPLAMQSAQSHKSYQMQLASDAGFAVPRTIISNNWHEIFSFLQSEEVILKMPFGMYYADQKERFMASTIVKRSDKDKLKHTMPFPGYWQEYIPKKREWRVTVVGERVFAATIYTTNQSRDDWRRHQLDDTLVRFEAEALPEQVANLCISVLRKLELRFGAFDLIEKPDGQFVFLEVNINGQYQWLVDDLKLPIPEAIADELIAIAV
jgi:glutathione synthase/RimK-type ligase-like ATP-grasp enzyme